MQHISDVKYHQLEIERLNYTIKRLKLYYSGYVPEIGYVWEEDETGNFDIIIDKNNLSLTHPDFIKYFDTIKCLTKECAYELWYKNIIELSIDNHYKKAYADIVDSLIPNGVKLLKKLDKGGNE